MELLTSIKDCLSDEFIFGTLKILKNEYSIISSMFIFPMAVWIWKKIKKITPWQEHDRLNGSEQYEVKSVERK